jgi:lysophospholipase L1-like esterase
VAELLSADATVARAAAEVLGDAPQRAPRLEKLLEESAPPIGAAAAGAALCREVPATPSPAHPAEQRAQRLSPAARATLRALAADDKLPLVDRLDLLGCLRTGDDPADRKLLDELARKAVRPLKARARALGGR